MTKVTNTTQFYKILDVLHSKKSGFTIEEISEKTGYPLPSLRRAISDMTKVNSVEKRILYRHKGDNAD